MLDWGPTYLKEVKHASLEQGGFSTAIYELGGMFSTVLMGWLSDKAGGRRGMVSVLCMVPFFWHSAAFCMRRRECCGSI
jgi:OPA family glycerol-3-phosphate transporter-like MFS transporter